MTPLLAMTLHILQERIKAKHGPHARFHVECHDFGVHLVHISGRYHIEEHVAFNFYLQGGWEDAITAYTLALAYCEEETADPPGMPPRPWRGP